MDRICVKKAGPACVKSRARKSPMGKEHLTGKIKQTVVRSTRMYDQSDAAQLQANYASAQTGPRNSNPCSPLFSPKLPSPSSRYG